MAGFRSIYDYDDDYEVMDRDYDLYKDDGKPGDTWNSTETIHPYFIMLTLIQNLS